MPTPPKFGSQSRVALAGSERPPLTQPEIHRLAHQVVNKVAAGEGRDPKQRTGTGRIDVSVIVRQKKPIDMTQFTKPGAVPMSRSEFSASHGADTASVEMVKQFAAEYGLKVDSLPEAGHRTVHLSGTQQQMEKAFGVQLKQVEIGGRQYRVREGTIQIPQELAGHVTAVLGLDNRPQAKPHNRRLRPHATADSYTPVQVGDLYGFPQGATASAQTIGILELGGGYRETDLTAYFQSLNLPAPSVTAVSVDSGQNQPSNPNSADGEVMLDIEICAAVARGAKIVVYFAPNTDQGFTDGISTAVQDTKNNPSVLSISWGGPESTWTSQAMTALDEACQSAAALGVTITVAAGDDGSTDGVSDGKNHVDFPASSPHVLACGGTKLVGSGTSITSEVVWNELSSNEGATGGGVSTVFALPSWQPSSSVQSATNQSQFRGVPDVAGDADPTTGYTIRVDGETAPIGGTSAVAPLWAGLIALANQQNGRNAGFANPTLYANPTALRDITSGNNGAFTARSGWDACTGLGSPNGAAVITALGVSSSKSRSATSASRRR
jgi:kumamolisin